MPNFERGRIQQNCRVDCDGNEIVAEEMHSRSWCDASSSELWLSSSSKSLLTLVAVSELPPLIAPGETAATGTPEKKYEKETFLVHQLYYIPMSNSILKRVTE